MIVEKNGKPYQVTTYCVDFGPKNGIAHVTVYDPCVTDVSRERRREAIARRCQELMQNELM